MRVRQVFSHGDKVDNVRLRLSSNRGAGIQPKVVLGHTNQALRRALVRHSLGAPRGQENMLKIKREVIR